MDIPLLPHDGHKPRSISPTDVSQFIRLEQCERYLRLRLHERNVSSGLMTDYGVVPQSIPPLLTRSGAQFETVIEDGVASQFRKVNFATDLPKDGQRREQNEQVVETARSLVVGEVCVLFQPRLAVEISGWLIRGDLDILRLERREDGLHVLIADMKSSTSAKNEHRLQVAFYHKMVAALFEQAGLAPFFIQTGVLYRGAELTDAGDTAALALRAAQLEAAESYFGVRSGPLEIVADPDAFLAEVDALVTDADSRVASILAKPFEEVPYHLTYKCDGCLFNEFCMKWIAQHDDLSLLPHLSVSEKTALQRGGVMTTTQLAALKELRPREASEKHLSELATAPGQDTLVRRLATTWPVGPHLDELVHRARRYRQWKGDKVAALSYIPSKGYGSLPYCDARHNPNLVRIYIDAQHDYLYDRIYMLGALVVACEDGAIVRRSSVVRLCDGPPDTPEKERALLIEWINATLRAVGEVAALDVDGEANAPLHLIFFNGFEQRLLLECLGRHSSEALATPLYDLVTQMPAFDSSNVSFLDQEIRELKNYPMVCQSLQTVAAYLRFDWNSPEPYREIFRTRLFDGWNKLEEEPVTDEITTDPALKEEILARGLDPIVEEGNMTDAHTWYSSRSRFNSQIPLEYAYAAWGTLAIPKQGSDPFESYRGATPANLIGFHKRRLEAMECIALDFKGNHQTEKSSFRLPDLATFQSKATDLAQALDEFVTIERHVELGAWKKARLTPPERRVLAGDTLIVRYLPEDQDEETRERNRDNEQRYEKERLWRASNPGVKMNKEQKAEMGWSNTGLRFRLRLDCADVDCDLDELLALASLRAGDRVVLCPRLTVDKRLATTEQTFFTPTPKQMLYGMRADIVALPVERNAEGRAERAWAEIEIPSPMGGFASRGFIFGAFSEPLHEGVLYTLDSDPNDWYGYFGSKVTEELCTGADNALFQRLSDPQNAQTKWPMPAVVGQALFLAGLIALSQLDPEYGFEPGKRAYIGEHGNAPVLLVQGPPGTGKSYATAFALWARMQGAMAAGMEWRIFAGCKTHAATDVLLENIAGVQKRLRAIQEKHPALFEQYFDARLLQVPLYRAGVTKAAEGIIPLPKKADLEKGQPYAAKVVAGQTWCIVGTTPGGVYRMVKDKGGTLCGQEFYQCLVLDEASQMNLPEAVMAALALASDGQLIVVGDHRQMPPIVKHKWQFEPRRTFAEFKSYASLFETLLALQPLKINFEESFRLHADMAEFLRQEIYCRDGIHYHSKRRKTLVAYEHADDFVHSVLLPQHPIIVIVHSEANSLLANPFERNLIAPILEALMGMHGLGAHEGLGVVVPHRAQRAALQEAVPNLRVIDPQSGEAIGSAVDTVERFQGGERDAILVGATESDPEYLIVSGQFLLDPRRLTVALSRAKQKMILVASRSVFDVFSADEETFANAQIWKNLRRRTCTVPLWQGQRYGHSVEVWGNTSLAPDISLRH